MHRRSSPAEADGEREREKENEDRKESCSGGVGGRKEPYEQLSTRRPCKKVRGEENAKRGGK